MKAILYGLVVVTLVLLCSTVSFAKDYLAETVGSYTLHHFEFTKDEARDMAKGPYKAKEYSDWIVELIGKTSGEISSKSVLQFKLTSMARAMVRQGIDTLNIELRSYDDGTGNWTVEVYDNVADSWKKLTD